VTVVLTHSFAGSAYPASPSDWGRGYQHEPETDRIAGAFRVVGEHYEDVVIGNGEEPEQFWVVPYEEWEEHAEQQHNPASPPFVEAIANPTIRAGLRRAIAEGRALARRCGQKGKSA
jgi:hypothetical protein